jgi:hypothetical protein
VYRVTLIGKIDALVSGLCRDDIERMPPLHRRRLAMALRRVADLADPPANAKPEESGILIRLRNGERPG